MVTILDGFSVSNQILQELKKKLAAIKEVPTLGIVLVRNNPASKIYVQKKIEAAKEVGIKTRFYHLKESVSELNLIKLVDQLNLDANINGFIVQLPLPKHISKEKVLDRVDPEKDVDGLNSQNLGKLCAGQLNETIIPATPYGILKLLEHYDINLEGKKAVVIGRSNLVGKPMALLLLGKNATVTIAHSQTKHLESYTKDADLIVAAIGKPNTITAEMVKPGAIIIDAGTTRVKGKLLGDVDFLGVKEKCSFITPVPGGVGPMTVAMLLYNLVYNLDKKRK